MVNLIISFLYIFSLPTVEAQNPLDQQVEENEVLTIEQFEEDVTGNGLKETIELKGILLSEDNNFYRDIWAKITSEHDKTWTISYLGGYAPKLQFITLPSKQEKGMFYHSKQSDKQHDKRSFLHTIVNGNLVEEDLPDNYFMSGSFQNQYRVHLSIHDELDPIILEIDQTKPYEGMYTKEGHLLEPTAVVVNNDASLTPTYISASKLHGIKGIQEVLHAKTNEVLGEIETLWYYENDRWIKLKEQWISP